MYVPCTHLTLPPVEEPSLFCHGDQNGRACFSRAWVNMDVFFPELMEIATIIGFNFTAAEGNEEIEYWMIFIDCGFFSCIGFL
jgi:hypothetical protein